MRPAALPTMLTTGLLAIGLLTLGLGPGAGLAPTAQALAEPPTCRGLPATIVGTDGDDDLPGTDGDDVVWLGPGDDTFDGGPGDDVICGGDGFDRLYGGEGDDWLDGGDGGDVVEGEAGDDVVHGGPGDDRLRGDGIRVADGADQVFGGDGDDDFRGEPGGAVDLVDGGPGVDSIHHYYVGDAVLIDAQAGTIAGRSPGSATDTVIGLERWTGSELDDIVRGSSGDDWLEGGTGDDLIQGRGGDDMLSAESGVVRGGAGHDTFFAYEETSHEITIRMGSGDDVVRLDSVIGTLARGGPGDDTFLVLSPIPHSEATGVRGHLVGGSGRDLLDFAEHRRPIRLDVRAGTATSRLAQLAFRGFEEHRGTALADTLIGSARDDVLRGRGGDDVLRGRNGDDVLIGGRGRDTAHGGPGRDRCRAERRVGCELR